MHRFEDIEDVILFARSLPDFPAKAPILACLEARNVNRYQEALGIITEAKLTLPPAEQNECNYLEDLEQRIKRLEASDLISD